MLARTWNLILALLPRKIEGKAREGKTENDASCDATTVAAPKKSHQTGITHKSLITVKPAESGNA